MSVDCSHIEEDWELFALGSVDEATQLTMASHLRSGCVECRRKLLEAQAALSAVAATAPARQPSARVERELMKRVRSEGLQRNAPAWGRWSLASWAFAAACLVLAGWLFLQKRSVSNELASAQAALQSMRQTASLPSNPTPQTPVVQTPSVATASPQTAGPVPVGTKKLAAMAMQVAELQSENAALASARADAEQQALQLQAKLNAAQSRVDELAQSVEATKKPEVVPNSTPLSQAAEAEVSALNSQLSESRLELQRLRQVRALDAQIENLLQSGSIQQIELRAVDTGAGKATARALYSPTGGLLLVASSLPKLEHEECYQLWLIRKGAPAILSAGLLQTSDDGRGFLFAPPTNDLAQLTGLAITDEPKGGSLSARGHKLLFGAQ